MMAETNFISLLQFQNRVGNWLLDCFGTETAEDLGERNFRFLEEALELVQSTGCSKAEAHKLVDYVFDRAVGDPRQEVGGVMITLAGLTYAAGISLREAAKTELLRVEDPATMQKIRRKHELKPHRSPLPGDYNILMWRERSMTKRSLYTYAVIWTLLMIGFAVLNNGAPPAIIFATASMWFWLGRFSKSSEILMDDELVPPPAPKWGRGE